MDKYNSRPKTYEEFLIKFKDILNKCPINHNGCILFNGVLDKNGYGRIKFQYKIYLTHRLVWQINNGQIEKDLVICHKCDNPTCINIEHLFIGTILDNNLDKIKKGRDHNKSKTHCKHGHELSGNNLYIGKDNRRQCKTCDRLRHRKK